MPDSDTRKDDAPHEPSMEIEKDKEKSSKSKGSAKGAYSIMHPTWL